MNHKPIRLLLCDFDGTLVDTRMANALAYIETLREVGIEISVEEYLATYFGMRCNEFMCRMGITDPAERERLRLRKIALYPNYFDTLRLNEPLWAFAQSVRRQGGKVWIVSTGSRANIDNVMRDLDAAGFHHGVLGVEFAVGLLVGLRDPADALDDLQTFQQLHVHPAGVADEAKDGDLLAFGNVDVQSHPAQPVDEMFTLCDGSSLFQYCDHKLSLLK